MFHANGWTFVWTVTAAGGTHVCLRKVDAAAIYALVNVEQVSMLCAAPTVLIAVANGPEAQRRGLRRGVRVLTAGAPPAAATIGRIEGELGWVVTHVYGLTETAPFILVCEPRPEDAGLAAGAVGDAQGAPGGGADHFRGAAVVDDERTARCPPTAPRSARSSCAATSS